MTSYLIHYGTKGQKWGDRKYQYEDGSLTPEGKIHYGVGQGKKGSYNPPSYDYKKKKYKGSNQKINSKGKSKKSNYNVQKHMKTSVKSINKDKKFIDKAHDFLNTPLGRIIVGTAISGIVGIGVSILKEEVLGNIKSAKKYKQDKEKYGMSEAQWYRKQQEEKQKNHEVKFDPLAGAKVFDMATGNPIEDMPKDNTEAMNAIFGKKKKK